MMNRYAYYPGCSLHSTATEYDHSLKKVFAKLGLQLEEPKDWLCCGASAAYCIDELMAVSLPMQTLQSIEEMGLNEVVVPCAACFQRLKTATFEMRKSPMIEDQVEQVLGKKYGYSVAVRHPLEIVEELISSDAGKDLLVQDLGQMPVASYYGCMLTRPPKIMQFDRHENPVIMDQLIGSLGGVAVDWSYKVDCCGASLALNEPDIVLKLAREILENAVESGAELIVVACQLCQANLDMRQTQINAKYSTNIQIPILYFSQLVGLALGIGPKQLGLRKHLTYPMPVLERYGLV